MCSINHNLKCVYLHLPKCGGSYISEILEKFYDFKTYFFTSENHKDFVNDPILNSLNYSIDKGFFFIQKRGMYRYFRYSEKFNILSGMDENKWKEYYKFTFIRHPFDKFVSAYKYLKLNKKNISFMEILNKKKITPYEYFHIYLSLYDNIINNDMNIEFNYIAHYENLNDELINIFNNLGITEIKHKHFILNNIVINSSDSNKIVVEDFINEDFINLFNEKFKDDYKYFDYEYISINNYKNFIFDNKKILINNTELIKKYNLQKNLNNCNIILDKSIYNKLTDFNIILQNNKSPIYKLFH